LQISSPTTFLCHTQAEQNVKDGVIISGQPMYLPDCVFPLSIILPTIYDIYRENFSL